MKNWEWGYDGEGSGTEPLNSILSGETRIINGSYFVCIPGWL